MLVTTMSMIASATTPAGATDYYVSTSGDDSNLGTLESPWRSIQRALGQVGAGDRVFVRGGVYEEEVVVPAGAEETPVELLAYDNEEVVLDGGNALRHGVTLNSHTVVDGLSAINFTGNAFVAWETQNDLKLKNLVARGNGGTGIRLFNGSGTKIENALLQNNAFGGFDCSPIRGSGGPGCTHLQINDVRATENGQGNETAIDAFAVEEGSDILIEGSVARGGPGDGFDFKSDRTTVRRVVSSGNARNGIKLWGTDTRLENALSADNGMDLLVLPGPGPYTVINSTFANTGLRGYTVSIGDYDHQDNPTIATLSNNIFASIKQQLDGDGTPAGSNGTLVFFSNSVQLTADHNIYFSPRRTDCVITAGFVGEDGCFSDFDINNGRWQLRSGQDQASVYSDPLFVDGESESPDYHLSSSSSPAVDGGSSNDAPGVDLECRQRPEGTAFDIGPFEFGAQQAECLQGGSEPGGPGPPVPDIPDGPTPPKSPPIAPPETGKVPPKKGKKRGAKIIGLSAHIRKAKPKKRSGSSRTRPTESKYRLFVRFRSTLKTKVKLTIARQNSKNCVRSRRGTQRKVVSRKSCKKEHTLINKTLKTVPGINRYRFPFKWRHGGYIAKVSVIGGDSYAKTKIKH